MSVPIASHGARVPSHKRRVSSFAASVGLVTAALAAFSTPAHAAGSIVVNPSTNLTDGVTVVVTGTGFTPNATVAAIECAASAVTSCDFSTVGISSADASGNYVINVHVVTQLNTNAGVYDCAAAPGTCVIKSSEIINPLPNTATLSFLPTATPLRGTIDVPSPVVAGTYPFVSGAGWSANTYLQIAQCPAGEPDPSLCDFPETVRTDATGSFTTSYLAHASITGSECSIPGACTMVAADVRNRLATSVAVPLLVTTPLIGTFTVTPATGLHANDVVQLDGAGWSPDAFLTARQCFGGCSAAAYLGGLQVANDGTFHHAVQVARFQYGEVVCGDPGIQCAIELRDDNIANAIATTRPISFTPMALPAQGQFSSPPSGTVYATVALSGTGWVPEAPLAVAQCPTASITDLCNVETFPADPHGNFSYDFGAIFDDVGGTDCTLPGTCTLIVWEERSPNTTAVVNPFRVVVPPPGTITVSPKSSLTEGSVVTVTGHGWLANHDVLIAQCAVVDQPTCMNPNRVATITDASGDFVLQVTLSDAVQSGNWLVDCTVAASTCDIRAIETFARVENVASTSITFDPNTTTVVSNYSVVEAAQVQAAASALGVSVSDYQRVSVWCTSWLLSITNTSDLPSPTPAGSSTIRTTYPAWEARFVDDIASSYALTLAEYQKRSSLLVANLVS